MSKISSFQNYLYSLPFFQRYYHHPIYFPSFHHLRRFTTLLFPRKVVRTRFQILKSKIMFEKKSPKLFKFMPLKKRRRKEVKENPNLVANGRFQCLVALGRRRKNIFFTSSHFPPNTCYLNFFSIDLKILLYHGSRPLLTPFLPFP